MLDELSEPALRNPQHIEDFASIVRIMLGEVRLRTEEEKSARATSDVSIRLNPHMLPQQVLSQQHRP
eukprot:12883294-Prorocentrum_lima.AAC.1